jgi:hypothetical protein
MTRGLTFLKVSYSYRHSLGVHISVTGVSIKLDMRDFRLAPRVDDICAITGYCAACGGNSLPTFRDNLSVPS